MIARLEPYILTHNQPQQNHKKPKLNNLDLGTKLAESEEWH
jgi:hypothetical protein